MKPKILLPSLKEKKRYLAFELVSEEKIAFEKVKQAIQMEMTILIGNLGLAKAGLMFLDDWENNKGILRINNKMVNETKAALTMIKEIDNQKAIVKSIGVSGILNKLRQKGGF